MNTQPTNIPISPENQPPQHNKHLEHLEDSVWQGTTKQAYDILTDTIRLVNTGKLLHTHLTIKYDGAPAIVFGLDDQGKFFVSTKAAFAKDPTRLYSLEDIKVFCAKKPQLAAKLTAAFQALSQHSWQGVFQADLLYTPGDIYDCGIAEDGSIQLADNTHLGFTPNTLTYAVDKKTALAKRIRTSTVGMIIHTGYQWIEHDGNKVLDRTQQLPEYTLPAGVWSPSLAVKLQKQRDMLPKPDLFLKKEHIRIAEQVARMMQKLPYITAGQVQTNINRAIREQDDAFWETLAAKEQFFDHRVNIINNYYTKSIDTVTKKITTRAVKLPNLEADYHKKKHIHEKELRAYEKQVRLLENNIADTETIESETPLVVKKSKKVTTKKTPKLPIIKPAPLRTKEHQKIKDEHTDFLQQKRHFVAAQKKDIAYITKQKPLLEKAVDTRYSLQQQKNDVIEALDKNLHTTLLTYLPGIDTPVGGEGYVATHKAGDMMKLVSRGAFSRTNFLAEKTNWMLPGKTIFVVYGRMNPPTKGHIALIKEAYKVAQLHGAILRVYVTRTMDSEKNPLPPELKQQILQAGLQLDDIEICLVDEDNGSLITLVENLAGEGYRNIVLMGGSDRVELMDQATITATEQGSKLMYKVVGDTRSEIADALTDLSGVSASKVRQAARDGDRDLFVALLPENLSQELQEKVWKGIRGEE